MSPIYRLLFLTPLLFWGGQAGARDPAFQAQRKCKGAHPCSGLQAHILRLRERLNKVRGRDRVRVQFILASLDGLEALRLNDKALAGQSVERFKKVAKAGPSHHLADDALVMMARLRILRGDKKRALLSLKQVACHYRKSDMVGRVQQLWMRWSEDPEMGKCADGKQPARPAGSKADGKTEPVKPTKVVDGLVDTGGGALHAAVERIERIVIDPGHGGSDPGALGPGNLKESDLAYALASDLAMVLRDEGYDVQMTREEDEGLKLAQRTRFANQQDADLFISIHVSSADNSRAHGVETYYLNTGSDRYATRLAARENQQTEEQVSTLAFILADLATKGNTVDSRALAKLLQAEMKGLASDRKKELRAALFYVLLGARMPAVLFEAGFMSNADDVARLQNDRTRLDLARRIAKGIQRFADYVDRQ